MPLTHPSCLPPATFSGKGSSGTSQTCPLCGEPGPHRDISPSPLPAFQLGLPYRTDQRQCDSSFFTLADISYIRPQAPCCVLMGSGHDTQNQGTTQGRGQQVSTCSPTGTCGVKETSRSSTHCKGYKDPAQKTNTGKAFFSFSSTPPGF